MNHDEGRRSSVQADGCLVDVECASLAAEDAGAVTSVVVTGATGYTGYRLVRSLLGRGIEVHALVRNAEAPVLVGMAGRLRIHAYDGSYPCVRALVAAHRPSVVFHLANSSFDHKCPESVRACLDANVTLACFLLQAMADHGPAHLVLAGSYWEHAEGSSSLVPNGVYAAAKTASWLLAQSYARNAGMRVTSLVLFDSYGCDDFRNKIFNQLERLAAAKRDVPLTQGQQTLYPVHIDDIVSAFEIAGLHRSIEGSPTPERFFLPGPEGMTLRSMVERYCRSRRLDVRLQWGAVPYPKGQIMSPYIGRILPGWKAKVAFEAGIALH